MKKLMIVLSFLAVGVTAEAQELRAGLKGAFNSTWLFNKDVSDAGDNLDYASTFGNQFGVMAAYGFNEAVGVSLEILLGSVNQKYTGKIGGTTYDAETKLSYIDIPVLLRMTSSKGPFLEVGPQFSFLSKAKADQTFSPANNLDPNYSDRDIKDGINSTNFSGVLGFGVDIDAGDKLDVIAGLRFAYGFTDVSDGKNGKANKPTNTAIGGLHVGLLYKINP